MPKGLKFVASLILAFVILICIRLVFVQVSLKNQTVILSDLSDSGYTAPGLTGHGRVLFKDDDVTRLGWHVYDIPTAEGRVQKVCAEGGRPTPYMDVDFFYFDMKWYKLRSGALVLNASGFKIEPPTLKRRGLVSATAFPVRSPDVIYRMKILSSKLRYGSLSPLEYLQSLKVSNSSCQDMPDP